MSPQRLKPIFKWSKSPTGREEGCGEGTRDGYCPKLNTLNFKQDKYNTIQLVKTKDEEENLKSSQKKNYQKDNNKIYNWLSSKRNGSQETMR